MRLVFQIVLSWPKSAVTLELLEYTRCLGDSGLQEGASAGGARRLTWLVGVIPREEGDCQVVSDQKRGKLVPKAVFMPKPLGGEKTG